MGSKSNKIYTHNLMLASNEEEKEDGFKTFMPLSLHKAKSLLKSS